MSNEEMIKQMDTKQLARFINRYVPNCSTICDALDAGCSYSCPYNGGDDIIEEWLKSESEVRDEHPQR